VSHGFENRLKAALEINLPYSNRARLSGMTSPAAVLLLFAMNRMGQSSLLFIRRAEEIGPHSGQMAFPGGKAESFDQSDPVVTALRETHEEVGVERSQVRVLGRLPQIATPTRYAIDPIVGILRGTQEEVVFRLDPLEVAETVWIPFSVLLTQGVHALEFMRYGDVNYPIDVFQVDQYRIWGATGSMTKNLVDRYNIYKLK